MANGNNVGLFGREMRWYVDQAEWPFVALASVFILGFIVSYWLEISYLEVVAPLALVIQIVAAVAVAYLTGIRAGATLGQVTITCALVAAAGGLINAFFSFIRFFYPWLLLNLVTEPIWSALLAVGIGIITIGFFNLPKLIKSKQAP